MNDQELRRHKKGVAFLGVIASVSSGLCVVSIWQAFLALSLVSDSIFTRGWGALFTWSVMGFCTGAIAICYLIKFYSSRAVLDNSGPPMWSPRKKPRMWRKLQQRIAEDDSEPE